MPAPTDSLADLFSAAAAQLRGDTDGVLTVILSCLDSGGIDAFPFAGVMACGEYLRDTADNRDIAPTRLLQILCDAHDQMLEPGAVDVEGLILHGVRGYLSGEREWWGDEQLALLGAAPMRSAHGTVRVLAAAMTWRAADLRVAPHDLAAQVCLKIAERSCGLTPA